MLNQKGYSWLLIVIVASIIFVTLLIFSLETLKTLIYGSNTLPVPNNSENSKAESLTQKNAASNESENLQLLNSVLENFEKNETFTIELLTKAHVKRDGKIFVEFESNGVSFGDNTRVAEKTHFEYKHPDTPEYDGSTDTVVFYRENLALGKRPTSFNKWVALKIKDNTLTKLPKGLTFLLVKSIDPSSLRISGQRIINADIDPKVYFANYELFKKEPGLYKDTKITVEFWINDSNQFSKIKYNVQNEPYGAGVNYGEVFDSENTLTYAKLNEPVVIEKPSENIISIEELRKLDSPAASIMEEVATSISAAY